MGVNTGIGVTDGTAAFWTGFVAVCRAAAGVGAGRKAVAGLLGAARETLPDEVMERLAPLLVAPAVPARDGGWLAMMLRTEKIGDAEVRAAREIVHVLKLRLEACSGAVPAVDPTRLIVDGGPNPGQRMYGVAFDPAVTRYDAWVEGVKGLADRQRVLRGRNANLSLLILVQKVLAEGVGPNTLDKQLGVRNGRCGDAVLRELKRYADYHFRS